MAIDRKAISQALFAGVEPAAADWIPPDAAVCDLASKAGLEVRFPVRKKADLLPFTRLSHSEAIELLTAHFARNGVTLENTAIADIVGQQLFIEGTFAMHSKTAAQNGGDFDYDCICVIPSSTFPRFVESRVHMKVETRTKNKKARPKAPWWNLAEVAMEAKGNLIGWITDMTSAALAASRFEAYDSLSKVYGLGGLRIGWMVGPEPILKKARLILDYIECDLPSPSASIALAALRRGDIADVGDHEQRTLDRDGSCRWHAGAGGERPEGAGRQHEHHHERPEQLRYFHEYLRRWVRQAKFVGND